MNAIAGLGITHPSQYLSQSRNSRVEGSASEEANESSSERAAEASRSKTGKLDVYA